MNVFRRVEGGVTAPRGFRASGVAAGIKKAGPDLALLASNAPATVAGIFTSNRIKGAPVRLCLERLRRGGAVRAIVANSGNANACNGAQGLEDARRMAAWTASGLGVGEEAVLVCSTGVIGRRLPMDRVQAGIRSAVESLSEQGGGAAACAIMTTDTVPKQEALEIGIDRRAVRIGGMAKGAGMIEPNLATMLAFITTDAAVEQEALAACLAEGAAESFNRISIDGDQSCNDTALFMANGMAGNPPLKPGRRGWETFVAAAKDVMRELALKLVQDGEGVTKLVTVRVRRAATQDDARRVARAVANSLLVKTSWYGADPNWGRVMDAVGYSGAEVDETRVEILYDEVCVARDGQAVADVPLQALRRVLSGRSFCVVIDLHLGDGADVVYSCDCSEEYVRINSAYTT